MSKLLKLMSSNSHYHIPVDKSINPIPTVKTIPITKTKWLLSSVLARKLPSLKPFMPLWLSPKELQGSLVLVGGACLLMFSSDRKTEDVDIAVTAPSLHAFFEAAANREYHGFRYPPWVVGRVRGVQVWVAKIIPSPNPHL